MRKPKSIGMPQLLIMDDIHMTRLHDLGQITSHGSNLALGGIYEPKSKRPFLDDVVTDVDRALSTKSFSHKGRAL
jgi:hypothetical protein